MYIIFSFLCGRCTLNRPNTLLYLPRCYLVRTACLFVVRIKSQLDWSQKISESLLWQIRCPLICRSPSSPRSPASHLELRLCGWVPWGFSRASHSSIKNPSCMLFRQNHHILVIVVIFISERKKKKKSKWQIEGAFRWFQDVTVTGSCAGWWSRVPHYTCFCSFVLFFFFFLLKV